MTNNPIQDFLSNIGIPFLGDNLMRKYENEKSPLRAELFTITQLEQYATSLATTHAISSGPSPDLLIKRLHENEEILMEVRNLLIESAKENSAISPAGEWLLDNFYLIEEQIRIGKKHFPKGYSETLPRLAKGPLAGFPRVYNIALEIISHSDGRVDLANLYSFVSAYQKVAILNLGELWAIPIMLRLALIENLRRLAAQIAIDRINKNQADYWADRMTEVAEKDPKSLIIVTADMARSDPPMVSSFVAEITRRLLGKGPALTLPLTWIEQRLSENGLTTNGLVYQETQKQAAGQVSISNSIGSLRFLNITDWREFVESTSAVERVLREDIGGIYPNMDFHTRDRYRHVIENIAKQSHLTELQVAHIAVGHAAKQTDKKEDSLRFKHVGYFLIDKGIAELEKSTGIPLSRFEKVRRMICSIPFVWYAGSIIVLSVALSGILVIHAYREGILPGWLILMGMVSFIASSHLATAFINWLSTILIKPDFLPRMNYLKGIPPESRTLVVVPTLFNSISELEELIETMEVRYLANKQENLHFALLTDFRDAKEEKLPDDNPLLEYARQRISELNQKYLSNTKDLFFLLHRPRLWNAADKIWMGYERKRGKLGDLNSLLRGRSKEKFQLIVGNEEVLHQVKYVITLDSDTQLPREAAWKIVGTIAHPLNQPYYDEKKKRVTRGYGILQPRLATNLIHSGGSWYARLHGNEPGIDPYTRAVSDVYQDVVKEGSFIGKGIYDVDAFEKALSERFPENRILSHDLLEGCHARSGLISDVQLYEEYPSGYLPDMKRRHRWIRGDWQIGRWMLPRVPSAIKGKQKNPLSAISRWKIFDNLRRSLVPPSLLALLVFGWIITTTPWFWTFTVIGIIIPPSILSFAFSLFQKPKEVLFINHVILSIESFVNQIVQHIWSIISLPYEAYINIDAIINTLWRMVISHRKLLQWDPSINTPGPKSLVMHYSIMWISPVLGILLLLVLTVLSWSAFIIASPIATLWILSPFIAWWISIPQEKKQAILSEQQRTFLRKHARKTWAFFENFIGPDDHWLPPDNYQEHPSPRIAHRTSPTNMGLSLLSSLAAYDFGYIHSKDLLDHCEKSLATMQGLERYRGHLLNWYDTQSGAALHPRYVSTVDSGNLAACLLTLKEGLISIQHERVINSNLYEGILDTLGVLKEKLKDAGLKEKIKQEIQTHLADKSLTLSGTKIFLERIVNFSREILNSIPHDPDSEAVWWSRSLETQSTHAYVEISALLPWIDKTETPARFSRLSFMFEQIPSINEISQLASVMNAILDQKDEGAYTPEERSWIASFKHQIESAAIAARDRIQLIEELVRRCIDLSNYEYDFLFDKTQHYFSIGYNVDEHRRDPGYYDLLGSEARLGIYVAIAQGKIPQESWFALGRQLTNPGTDPVLISWSGSMFEYLMPLLLMPSYESTLLEQTHKAAVKRQIEYGNKRGLPWGISESCFNMVHANMDYQYRAFGVPGMGLKRGLAEDYVVAPYASMMALMVDPESAYHNLKEMSSQGFEGRWGYYEAIDYTPARLPRGQNAVVIKAFMTHHQGMSLLSLSYVLKNQLMQKRFEADLQFQTSLLLLQEKIPQVSAFYSPAFDVGELPTETLNTDLRIIHTPNTPVPEVQLLSNGRFHVMVTNSGGGYTRWRDIALTRWREDGTCDHWGSFCFIRDLETNDFWSSAYQPSLHEADHYEVIFSQGRAEFRRRDYNIETHTEIVVSPEDDVEMRRLHITNRSRKRRQIEITTYSEVVLNIGIAETLHPSFSNLFVQTEIIDEKNTILCTRRPRSVEENPSWMFHLMKVHGVEEQSVSYETSRDEFVGRGNTIEYPAAMQKAEGLAGTQGSVLDPIVSIQYRISLKPYESVTADMVYGIGKTSDVCHHLIEKYQDKHLTDRAFELAWTHSHVVLRQINATAADSLLYCRLAGSIIYANASLRTDPSVIIKNQKGQSGLWSHSISGDWPIVLLQIEDSANIDLVQQMVQAHAFWRLKGLIVDLVIWNEDHGGYRQVLQNQILSLIAPTYNTDNKDKPGGIFIRSADQLSNEDRILFQTVARVIISDKLGTLEGQLNRRKRLKPVISNFAASRPHSPSEIFIKQHDGLVFYNGLGGFTPDGKEYIINTSSENITPAPWSNVIANPHFGTVISESGQSYTWFQNAHELRLTPWHNDPVTDLGGEHFYIRDEETGRYWSPAPLPSRGKTPYITRHGFGYSVFGHIEDGIHSEMWVYVDPDKPIKYTVIKFRNVSGRARQISVTGYVEWVLGDLRHKTLMHIITDLDLNSGAIIARNSYYTEFGQLVAFLEASETTRSITTDRDEFIGRNGTVANPEALKKTKLSGKTGAGLDACAVIQLPIDLAEGEESEIIFRLGTGMHINDVTYLLRQSRTKAAAREALEKVKQYWENKLSVILVDSPDVSLNILTNGWLNYQTLACRMWARSGYYQSGGAFGFRDQLQDVMSVMHNEPLLARNHIILCASRQFIQGDVQHWWHPPVGRGVRTKCSDDYLWLPYVTSRYVMVTGDETILDENISYLESRELNKGEHSYYDLPIRSEQSGSLYEHCVKALEYGFQFGEHGLPLMGAGDWNDGMDRVGSEGKGESVWLGWFLFDTIQRFSEIVSIKKDQDRKARYSVVADELKMNIEKHAWDGDWYRRAYFDDGTPLGSKLNDECKIDSIAQSWSVLSGAGEKNHASAGMMEAEKRLVRKQDKIIQLFDPPFDKSDLNPGYIKGYVPGVRENGGQYTHAAIWMIMAFATMKEKTKMWELLQMINPIHHGSSQESISVYKVEPYVVAADVYAVSQHSGRGGWTWYTGSAGWMYQLIIEYVLGLRRKGTHLTFEPCLPEEWEIVSIRYRYLTSIYNIRMIQHNPASQNLSVILDHEERGENSIALVDDGLEHQVEVLIN